jgi:hypothetical protein
MSRPTHRWGSNIRQGSDDDDDDFAGSSSREWRTRRVWKPQHQSQPQRRNDPVTSSWQGTGAERQQRSWHRGAVTTLRQSDARPLRQQQPLRSAEASSPPATALPWRPRNECAEQQQNPPPRLSWHPRERDDRGRQSGQEPFAQQRRAWPTRAWPETREPTATGRVKQERVRIHRRPRDWDDPRLSPRPTRHIDEQYPEGKLLSRDTSAVNQSRPWRQAVGRDTCHDSASEGIDFQRDCHHERRFVAESVQERKPAEKIDRRATSNGRGTFTSSTRLTVTHNRVVARPWATKANAPHRADYNEQYVSSSAARNGVVVDPTSMQATEDQDYDPSSDYEDRDDPDDDGDVVVFDHIDDCDSREVPIGVG